ncbi:hypothetical protein AB4543_19780 [Vibrio splendidus]
MRSNIFVSDNRTIDIFRHLIAFSIVFGLLISGYIDYSLPDIRKLMIVFVLFGLFFIKRISKFEIVVLSYCIFSILAISLFGYEDKLAAISNSFFFTCVIIGYIVSKFRHEVYIWLVFAVFLNFILLVYEMNTRDYIFPGLNDFIFGRGKGLFSYSKLAGYFYLFFYLTYYHRLSLNCKIVIFLSCVMTGTRVAMVPLFIMLVWDVLSYSRFNIKKSLAIVIPAILYGSYKLLLIFQETDVTMFSRLFNVFDLDSHSNSERVDFFISYINGISEYSVINGIFGNMGYLRHIIGNGAENTYLNVIADAGLIGGLFYIFLVIILLLIVFSDLKRYWMIACVPLVFMGARIGISYPDGGLLWSFIFVFFSGKINEEY